MTITAVDTAYTMADPRTGKPCHRDSMCKRPSSSGRMEWNMRSAYRNARKNDSIGLHIAAGLVNYISGVGMCSACGEYGTLALGGPLTLELAHDIPSCEGGAMCWCSLTLQHSFCNKIMGDKANLDGFDLHCDARVFASVGGYWAPWQGTRDSFSYATFERMHPKARANVEAWQPRTVAAHVLWEDCLRKVK